MNNSQALHQFRASGCLTVYPQLRGSDVVCAMQRPGFDPWVKIPGEGMATAAAFFTGEFHGRGAERVHVL